MKKTKTIKKLSIPKLGYFQCSLPEPVIEKIRELAEKENRTLAGMARVLLLEALQSHK